MHKSHPSFTVGKENSDISDNTSINVYYNRYTLG